jgi:7,8-dihydropterin-6-yl-methyl-4-(beta-D-ribofuranosyl)aminobenzene 5'-phosphate synthase
MTWTVLSDNRTNDDQLQTEHGLSILLETDKHRILLDTGASDVFILNAEKMGIDLSMVDYVFISHGHSDHAGGLKHLMKINDKALFILSPDAVRGKFYSQRHYLHSIMTEWPKGSKERCLMIDKTCEVAEGLHVIAHIPQSHPMPKGNRHLFVENAEGNYVNDDFRHELALYTDGLLFTGCAHSGLENILSACPYPVKTVVGGFHLLDDHETKEELTELANRLAGAYPNTQFYTSHCTGDKVFEVMKSVMGEQLHTFSCGTKDDGLFKFEKRMNK